ncbi:outer membrane beta-barrel protein [Bacteroidota bacterium]
MRKILIVLVLVAVNFVSAQDKGTVMGLVSDKEMNNESLPFANVFVKGTAIGVTTDFDGNYSLDLEAGSWVVVFSFVGYQTVEVPVEVVAGQNITINQVLGADEGVGLDEVIVKATTSRVTEEALLGEQKGAVVIKESIGAQRLSKVGVSNAAGATTKIAGVTKSESSSAVFIRGLGDRYLSTTMNGLPIPSDDVENKNINLNLFSTGVIQNVGISKTYNTSGYADQASGNVDVATKIYSREELILGLQGGFNGNVVKSDIRNNFKVSQSYQDVTLGFHSKQLGLKDAITGQSWNPENINALGNFGVSVSGGKKLAIFEKDFSVFGTVAHNKSYSHRKGIFKSFRSNILNNSFSDTERYSVSINTTALLNIGFRLNDVNKFKFNSLFVNKTSDNLFEQGRNGEGYVFDQDPAEYGAFVRDQNVKQTTMWVNQLLGEHNLGEDNKLSWAGGMNYVLSEEPNRIRNEVNIETTSYPNDVQPIDFKNGNTVQFSHVGDFQQRKSGQKVEDIEYNGYLKDQLIFRNLDEDGGFKLKAGLNFRRKERVFSSLFVGVRAKGFQTASVDDLGAAFTQYNFNNQSLVLRNRQPDVYLANLNVFGAYTNFDFIFGELSGNVGVRYEIDNIKVDWDVSNYVGRKGSIENDYTNILPSLNLKYALNETNFIRFATSLTNTLPEFKELAPFEYVSPTGRVTKGNPELVKSDNMNIDLKWEAFPESGNLFSVTTFYKQIKNPINLAQSRGSSGNFSYANTGEKANIYGLELEGRVDLFDNDDSKLNLNMNATKMWFNQDLLEEYQYKGKTATDLQGASDLILNTALSFNTKEEKEFSATASLNYSSDKVAILGAPESFDNSATLYNDEIIENGFWTLDMVFSKELSEKLSLKLRGRNLLNPAIKQSQKILPLSTGVETNEVVSSYKKGSQVTLSLKYKF